MASSSSSSSASNDLLSSVSYAAPSSPSSQKVDYDASPSAASILSSSPTSAALHPLAGLGDSSELDYLLLEDEKLQNLDGAHTVLPTRGWGDELCYGTGTTYLTGLAVGGLWGLREGLKTPLAARMTAFGKMEAAAAGAPPTSAFAHAQAHAHAQSIHGTATASGTATLHSAATDAKPVASTVRKGVPFRLRLNTVLNAVTRRGSFTGNTAGVLALFYNGFNSSFDRLRGKHDVYGSMAAGAITGMIWRSTAGIRPMIIASSTLTVAAAAWTTFKHYLF